MNETIYLKKLEQREIKPTAIRLLILKTMMQHKEAFFTVGFGKRIGYGRQINHLPHHNPFFSPSSDSWH
jgi:hypothetical protein